MASDLLWHPRASELVGGGIFLEPACLDVPFGWDESSIYRDASFECIFPAYQRALHIDTVVRREGR